MRKISQKSRYRLKSLRTCLQVTEISKAKTNSHLGQCTIVIKRL